ncbi:hypothetical protein CDQ84_18725 [Clostridium thermosuccinogenes]|uniref:Tyr recombinase domain-containing protein n=1 Tax=Clostridium thermosuccinogenes TaxID=84032 RepID=A0A2K2EZ84_9CLOT|nr:hypothetical protein CDO33_06230 [Pseudoclostridium thermosuccinogenes]PNT91836.1 hypothetical protein CDQ85_18630 [Pseudoclostridium thermosuccinogenes]PNT94570.1 hypothetical protein CDQ84_18725 [Pseudoclostridium thermosuccinogenes]
MIHGRPNSESMYVFLRTKAPYQNLSNGVYIADIFNDYQKKAGIIRKPFDGKGFHAIRRAIGRNMAVAEIPVTTISQVLGHGDIESAKQYISLDSVHDMITYKESLGYTRVSYEPLLRDFDRFCQARFPEESLFKREIVLK